VAEYLVSGGKHCQLSVVDHHGLSSEGLQSWETSLREGPAIRCSDKIDNPQARFAQLAFQAQLCVARVVELLPLSQPPRLLDLGAGAGTYAQAILRLQPESSGRLYESPSLAPLLERELADWPAIEVCHEDIRVADFGHGYSLVLMSELVNYFTPESLQVILKRAASSLAPGGVLAVHDMLIPGQDALWEPLYSLRLLSQSSGQAYSLGQAVAMLQAAGLAAVEIHNLEPEPGHLLLASH